MKIVYYEEDDTLFIEFSKDAILRDESVSWNVNTGYTADGIGEITILDAQKSGIYPLQIERVVAGAAQRRLLLIHEGRRCSSGSGVALPCLFQHATQPIGVCVSP